MSPTPGDGAGVEGLRALLEGLPEELVAPAFRHSSWVDDKAESYGRPAFVGDSVLRLAVAHHLAATLPGAGVGELTKVLNQTVRASACAAVAKALGIPERMREAAPEAGHGLDVEELLSHVRPHAESLEAVIGACLAHYGYDRTAEAVIAAFAEQIEFARSERVDFKSALQERLARTGASVTYEVVAEDGPPHDRRFDVLARVGEEVLGTGSGRSKKEAEQAAASVALERLEG